MTSEQPNRVSVIDPIGPAIQRIKDVLFKPFNLSRWFTIGFCAGRAYLVWGGGGGGGGGGGHHNIGPHHHHPKMAESINSAKEYVLGNLYWIIPATAIAAVVIIGICLLIAWLNSRGKFMFLHCVAENKSEVKVPWRKFREHGNSLFLFRVVLGIISLAVVAVSGLGIALLVITMATRVFPAIASIPGIVIFGAIIFVLLVVVFLVKKFTFDFVVPIMFLRTTRCTAGWQEFLTILSVNKARFALYILFQIVMSIVIATIILIGFCIGCCFCCASILLLVPYIGTVILLPLIVFKQAYSLYYLRQFGPRFDVFGP